MYNASFSSRSVRVVARTLALTVAVGIGATLTAPEAGAQPSSQYQCYGLGPAAPFPTVPAILTDTFGEWTADLARPPRICMPATDSAGGAMVPGEPALVGYRVRGSEGTAPVMGQEVGNRFGIFHVDVGRPMRFMTVSAVSFELPAPPDPAGPGYVCHQVRRSRGAEQFPDAGPVEVTTALETVAVHPKKPLWLCAAADPALPPLTCYKARSRGRADGVEVHIGNQFGPQAHHLSGARREYCTESFLDPSSSTTSTTATSSTSTSSSTSSTSTSSSTSSTSTSSSTSSTSTSSSTSSSSTSSSTVCTIATATTIPGTVIVIPPPTIPCPSPSPTLPSP